jgi:hypothetical protein
MSNTVTAQEAANFLGFRKVGKHWWENKYVDLIEVTPYSLGDDLIIVTSDGIFPSNRKYTDKQLITLYESMLNVYPEEYL